MWKMGKEGTNYNRVLALAMAEHYTESHSNSGRRQVWAAIADLDTDLPGDQTFYVAARRSNTFGTTPAAATIKTRFFTAQNPESPKHTRFIDLYGSSGSSFNAATIVSENESLSLGAQTIGSNGIKRIGIPHSFNQGTQMIGLNLTTGAKAFTLDGVVFHSHVDEVRGN